MAGEYLTPHLPRGADARLFMQRINELQMLLHSHTVNLARDDEARPVVNGLWLWGGGTLTSATAPFDLIAADDFLTRALAQQSGVTPIATPKTLAELSPVPSRSGRAGSGRRGFFRRPRRAGYTNGAELVSALAASQMAWGRIKQLRLQLIGQHAATLTPPQVLAHLALTRSSAGHRNLTHARSDDGLAFEQSPRRTVGFVISWVGNHRGEQRGLIRTNAGGRRP
jgi:hypothetical protein